MNAGEIALAIGQAFANRTHQSASTLGLYALHTRHQFVLQLRDAITGAYHPIAVVQPAEAIATTAAALNAIASTRAALEGAPALWKTKQTRMRPPSIGRAEHSWKTSASRRTSEHARKTLSRSQTK